MGKVEHEKVTTIRGKLQGSSKAVGISLTLESPIEAEGIEAPVGNQVEDADPAVVPLRKIKGSIIRTHGHAQENTVRVCIGRFEAGWDLNDLGFGAAQLGDDGRKTGGCRCWR